MRPAAHLRLAVIAPLVWAAFWVLGWPDYYQQYSFVFVAAGSALLVPPTAWIGWRAVTRGNPDRRLSRAVWMSFWFTVPFLLLDTLYCGVWLGHGAGFLTRFWYLTIFYVLPWALWVPMGLLAPGTAPAAAK